MAQLQECVLIAAFRRRDKVGFASSTIGYSQAIFFARFRDDAILRHVRIDARRGTATD